MAISKSRAEERAVRAKAAVEAQQRHERIKNMVRGGITVVVLALLVTGIYLVTRGSGKIDAAAAFAPSEYEVSVGPSTAPHRVVVYEDFLCPFCGGFEAASHDQLAALAAAGKVQVDYRPFDLLGNGQADSYSVRSAAAFSVVLATSGTTVAKAYHDLLYQDQPSESASTFPSNDDLLALAVKAGATEADVKDGIESAGGVDWVTRATAAAEKPKVSSTPTILLDGRQFQDGSTVEELAANLITAVS